jgi:ThiF family
MALARYFRKNALALSQVLEGGSYEQFEEVLSKQVIGIAFDNTVETYGGRVLVDMAIRLICRLYPSISIIPIGNVHPHFVEECHSKAIAINGRIEITDATPDITLVIGRSSLTELVAGAVRYYIGCNNWEVLFSDQQAVGCISNDQPFAAGIAACIGAANVFRKVFEAWLPNVSIDSDVRLPLTAETTEKPTQDIGHIALAGLGAIGNGVLWALSHLQNVRGTVELIDHQQLEDTNLQRYVMCMENDEGKPKTEIAEACLSISGIKGLQRTQTWQSYVSTVSHWKDEVVLTALDSAKDRMEVQSSLPKYILNGFTDRGLLGISTHADFVVQPCLSCLYLPQGKVKHRSVRIAEELGIPEREEIVRQFLHYGKGVDEELLSWIATANDVAPERIAQFLGWPLENFYHRFVCGGILLEMQGAGRKNTIEAPLAFQSAWAGILLATELFLWKTDRKKIFHEVKHFYPLKAIDAPFNPYVHTIDKDSSGRCVCNDQYFLSAYKEKWDKQDKTDGLETIYTAETITVEVLDK